LNFPTNFLIHYVDDMKSFSVGWFVGITLLNLLGTALLGIMAFASAWGASYYGGPGQAGLHWTELILWIWSTGPMVASCFGLTVGNGLFVIIVFWAFVIGTIGGFVMPQIIERGKRRRFVDLDVPPDKS
jgi:hypothetical protein